MRPTAAEILESARALGPDDRADLAHELLVSLGEGELEEATKLEALRAAVAAAETSIGAGKGNQIPLPELRPWMEIAAPRAPAWVSPDGA